MPASLLHFTPIRCHRIGVTVSVSLFQCHCFMVTVSVSLYRCSGTGLPVQLSQCSFCGIAIMLLVYQQLHHSTDVTVLLPCVVNGWCRKWPVPCDTSTVCYLCHVLLVFCVTTTVCYLCCVLQVLCVIFTVYYRYSML